MTPKNYKDNFYALHLQNSINSAREVVPLFLAYYRPKSVLDIGCGLGTWLKIFEEHNCDVFGIDSGEVQVRDLLIDSAKFREIDLNEKFNLGKKYDLVVSLEVAEHILPENAKGFIESICFHGDIVLFSAAIPGQEGTLHYNEQYIDLWIELFSQNGFLCADFLRHLIWNNDKISWWYRQNILIFIKESVKDQFPLIASEVTNKRNTYVHPELLKYKCNKAEKFEKVLNSPLGILRYYLNNRKLP